MNYKSILFFLGIYSLLVSLFSILNILYSIYFDFIIDLNSYLITFFISLIVGSFFYYVGRNHNKDITLTDQIIFIVLSFILIPFLISIPYVLSIYDIGLLNSYFESVSGFTATGFSIIENVENVDIFIINHALHHCSNPSKSYNSTRLTHKKIGCSISL